MAILTQVWQVAARNKFAPAIQHIKQFFITKFSIIVSKWIIQICKNSIHLLKVSSFTEQKKQKKGYCLETL
jgi:hypothetical protein